MRTYDIPYVQRGAAQYYPVKPLEEMSLDEIKKKYIKMCAKANGDVSECSRCPTPCPEGKRATQLVANEVYNDPPIPLYGGKTLIEKAREENLKRRAEKEAQKEPEVRKLSGRRYIKDWYKHAAESGDAVAWLMNNYGYAKVEATQKIRTYLRRHPEDKDKYKKENIKNVEIKEEKEPVVKLTGDVSIESKLESLMQLQEEQKKAMDEYLKLYEAAKAEYEKIKQKTDILCSAMDILND